ncbi:hypothetical protein SEVIR_7G168151v4 [Setaria viridis]
MGGGPISPPPDHHHREFEEGQDRGGGRGGAHCEGTGGVEHYAWVTMSAGQIGGGDRDWIEVRRAAPEKHAAVSRTLPLGRRRGWTPGLLVHGRGDRGDSGGCPLMHCRGAVRQGSRRQQINSASEFGGDGRFGRIAFWQ